MRRGCVLLSVDLVDTGSSASTMQQLAHNVQAAVSCLVQDLPAAVRLKEQALMTVQVRSSRYS